MNKNFFSTDNPYSVFRIPEALTCWQAVIVMAVSSLIAVLLFALGAVLAKVSMIFLALFGLLAAIVVMAGISGAGICLTDLVANREFRSSFGYLLAGLFSLPKLIGAGLLMLLVFVGVILAVSVLLFVAKIPGLGPVLLVAIIPVAVVAMALMLVGYYTASSIVGPAIWDGERVMHSLSISWTIARQYPFAVLGKIFGGLFMSSIFAGILYGLLGAASMIVGSLTFSIIGSGMNIFAAMSGSGSGHMMGAAVGYALVFATASAFVVLLPLMVSVLTWRDFSARVNKEALRKQADIAVEGIKSAAAEAKEKAQAAASPVRQEPVASIQAVPVAQAHHCPKCNGEVQAGDRFCEHCGHQLA